MTKILGVSHLFDCTIEVVTVNLANVGLKRLLSVADALDDEHDLGHLFPPGVIWCVLLCAHQLVSV